MRRIYVILLLAMITGFVTAQVTKVIDNLDAGTLTTTLSVTEKATITNLTLSGNLDARDFKCMRDEMIVLAEIDLSAVNIVEYNGYEGTNGTTSTVYPANELPQNAFFHIENWNGKTTLTNFKFPISITSIGSFAFWGCWGLTSVTIPETVTTIGTDVFYNTNISTVTIPASVTSIGLCAFAIQDMIIVDSGNLNYSSVDGVLFNKAQTELIQCPYLKMGDYVIPSTVTTIGNNSFAFCGRLTSIIIPESVTLICFNAFQYCSSLTSLTIPATVTSIEKRGLARFFGMINVDSANPFYSSDDGVLFNKEKTMLIQCPITKSGSYSIPPTVISIEENAFDACTELTSIIIPASVTSIGNYAFYFCNKLTSIYSYASTPVNLSSTYSVFLYVNVNSCVLYVPLGSKLAYQTADQWKNFVQISEMSTVTSDDNVEGLDISISKLNNNIHIQGLRINAIIDLYSINGILISKTVSKSESIDIPAGKSGIYLLVVNGKTYKIAI